MSKIFKSITEYKEIFTCTDFTFDECKPSKVAIKRFIRILRNINDTRIPGKITYPLYEIILIAFLAILGNASNWYDIERFGNAYIKWLKKVIKLKDGIPSHDTFRRVFALINPKQMEEATVYFLMENMNSIKKALNIKDEGFKHYCIDGKEEKGTGRKYDTSEKVRNLQTLHVYDNSNEICLYSEIIDSKTNEIPTAQEILKTLQLKDAIITFDALHTQRETIKLIAEAKGDYVGALKGNQGTLEGLAIQCFTSAAKNKIKTDEKNYYETIEKAHNQIEKRRYYLIKAKQKIEGLMEWKKLKNFICYEKYTCNIITNKESTETRYYITSLNDIELCADAIRGHWGIENKLHWHLDYSFGQDEDTTMDKNAFVNLSLLNKLSLSLCKLFKVIDKGSIRGIRKGFGWSFEDYLSKLLNTFDEDLLKNALENAQNRKK